MDTASSYNNLGTAYASKKDMEKAIDCHRKSLEIKLAKLGESHPSVAMTYNNIGNAYADRKEYDRAILFHDKV